MITTLVELDVGGRGEGLEARFGGKVLWDNKGEGMDP